MNRRRFPAAALVCVLSLTTETPQGATSKGNEPVAAGLSSRCRAAVRHGMAHLKAFFEKQQNMAALGENAVSIFLELGETATDSTVKSRALWEARRIAVFLDGRLRTPGGLADPGNVRGALSLLPDARLLHLSQGDLLGALKARLAGRDADEAYYGTPFGSSRLGELSEDDLFDLLLAAYTVERARAAFPELPRPGLGLKEVLRFVFGKKLTGYREDTSKDHDVFQDHAYLATHVAFVLNDYGRLRLIPEELGSVMPWLEAQFEPLLLAGDEELVAELVDVFRSTGAGDEDPMVRRGSEFLLGKQRPDGSWGDWEKEEDPYDAIHPTWTAVHALRDRTFLTGTPYQRRVKEILREIRTEAPAGTR